MAAVKPKDRKMISNIYSLSLTWASFFSLTYALYLGECVYQIESLTLYLY